MPTHSSNSSSLLQTMSLHGISKSFPGVLANDKVDLEINASEIHALLGENGAGKSTLMKILYGFYRADAGEIRRNGQPVAIQAPHDARALQIGMVFQDFTLIPAMTVEENLALFLPHLPALLSHKEISNRINTVAERYGLRIDLRNLVAELSIGEQQKVEILKLLLAEARLLILDEPTRVLAPHEVEALFTTLKELRADGYAIVLITHKLKEVLDCADRITVLRAGRVAGTLLRREASEEKLVSLMFDRKLSSIREEGRASNLPSSSPPLLEFQGVSTTAEGTETSLKELNVKVHPGEIVGVAGVSGNGQRELGDAALGMIRIRSGKKYLFGRDFTQRSIQEVRQSGVAFIPENPLSMSIAPAMPVMANLALTRTRHYSRWGGFRLDWQAVWREADAAMKKYGFVFPLRVPARSLSGGNLQRMVIVREMAGNPNLIIASYLTRGLDVQSTIAARQALVDARREGAGILLISEDLEELFTLSDRLIVLYEGRIAGSFKPQETDIYQVGHLMTGSEVSHG